MGIVGNSAAPAKRTNTAPASRQQAAPPQGQRVRPSSLFGGGFKESQGRGQRGNYLQPIRPAKWEVRPDGSVEFTDHGEAATYTVKINQCSIKEEGASFKRRESFIVTFEVLESNCAACPVGYQGSWVTVAAYDGYQDEVKSFICEVLGADDPTQVDEEDLQSVLDGALIGKEVKVLVKDVRTKKNGHFTQHLWVGLDSDLPTE